MKLNFQWRKRDPWQEYKIPTPAMSSLILVDTFDFITDLLVPIDSIDKSMTMDNNRLVYVVRNSQKCS